MQVEMDHVKAHIARTHHPHDRIQVCAVVVVQPAGVVDDPGDLKDILVKDADCVRIGEHQARGVLTDRCTQLFQPSLFEGMLTTSYPTIDALAGLVPCAASGTMILVRFWSPRDSWYA